MVVLYGDINNFFYTNVNTQPLDAIYILTFSLEFKNHIDNQHIIGIEHNVLKGGEENKQHITTDIRNFDDQSGVYFVWIVPD